MSAAVTTSSMVFLLHWPLAPATLFGALIAATDPVAVIALFKDQKVGGRLRLLVESESLFNDGVAAVLFAVALAVALPGNTPLLPGPALLFTAKIVLGGLCVGAIVGGLAIVIAGRATDRLIETALTVVAAYGAFTAAESLHMSGILATVTCGLLMGNLGVLREDGGLISEDARSFVVEFWDFRASSRIPWSFRSSASASLRLRSIPVN